MTVPDRVHQLVGKHADREIRAERKSPVVASRGSAFSETLVGIAQLEIQGVEVRGPACLDIEAHGAVLDSRVVEGLDGHSAPLIRMVDEAEPATLVDEAAGIEGGLAALQRGPRDEVLHPVEEPRPRFARSRSGTALWHRQERHTIAEANTRRLPQDARKTDSGLPGSVHLSFGFQT